MRLGSHLSVSKGFDKTAEIAHDLGANTFQFFTRNPRGGAARKIDEKEIIAWQAVRKKYDLLHIVGHLPYTVNMAAQTERPYAFAKMVVADDLQRMEAVGIEYLVIHPGSHTGAGVGKGIERIVSCLEEAFLPHLGKTMLLLETMAGQGTEIGSVEEIAEIMERLGFPQNLGVCLDSCHLTGAGYDFKQPTEVDRLINDLQNTIGLERVKAVHLNDSKFAPGTHKDRHARIGEGYLGKEGILNFITHPFIRKLPLILETPVNDYQEYGEEIAMLRAWVEEKEQKRRG
ncbi:MAG: deoxyribonuclease IV [Firmicutes bacterium]|nr:deoxyribonuclease IV [Bacillota bacterium]